MSILHKKAAPKHEESHKKAPPHVIHVEPAPVVPRVQPVPVEAEPELSAVEHLARVVGYMSGHVGGAKEQAALAAAQAFLAKHGEGY